MIETKALPTAPATPARTLVARGSSLACAAVLACLGAAPALAHHSYSMFDTTKSVFVDGTVAKVEWVNPHTFVWLYVAKKDQPGEYDLYAFENGPITMLMRAGWTKETMKVGEKVTVQYFPLKDGRTGGSFVKAIHADGTESIGDQFAPGVADAAKLKRDAQ
jgi:hypothetical protein